MDEHKNTPEAYYTMAEAAQAKGCSYHTVSRAVRRGKLSVTRIGRMALVSGEDLDSWRPVYEKAPRQHRSKQIPDFDVAPTFVGEMKS